jgi:hypothetical protein
VNWTSAVQVLSVNDKQLHLLLIWSRARKLGIRPVVQSCSFSTNAEQLIGQGNRAANVEIVSMNFSLMRQQDYFGPWEIGFDCQMAGILSMRNWGRWIAQARNEQFITVPQIRLTFPK